MNTYKIKISFILFALFTLPLFAFGQGQNCSGFTTAGMSCFANGEVADANNVNKNFQELLAKITALETSLQTLENDKPKIAWLRHEKSSGNGVATIYGENPRILNTLSGDSSIVQLTNGSTGVDGTANQFTLQPGRYDIVGWTTAVKASASVAGQAWIRNVTTGTDVEATLGLSHRLNINISGQDPSVMLPISGGIEITEEQTFELILFTNSIYTWGSGHSAGSGKNEVYSMLRIMKY